MVAYSFKARFVQPILDGTKTQTIRAARKRHARPGEALQLYTAMRTKQCKLIRRAKCIDVADVRLLLGTAAGVVIGYGARATHPNPDDFARLDGFKDWADMVAFWNAEHPGADCFEGVLIRWAP